MDWKRQFPRPAGASERDAELETDGDAEVTASGIFRVPTPLHRELLRLGESEEAELSVTLLAAFQALLLRTAGQDRIVVDAILSEPAPQGNALSVSATIGTADLPDDPVLRDFVTGARDQWRRCQVAASSPGNAADETGGRSAAAPPPSAGAAFTMGSVADRLTGRDIEQRLLSDAGVCLVPTLRLLQTGDGLFGLFVPSGSGLLSESDPSGIGARYLRLLRGVSQDIHRPIRSIPLLSDEEREQILFEWNDNAAAYPSDACIHQLVEAQAKRSPDAAAIASSRDVLTYRDLDERSNRIAAYFLDRGAGAETIVAFYLDRSVESLAGILGVLKSGAAYAPLDPEHPRDLTDMILEDLGRPMLLTQDRFADRFTAHPRSIIRLDGDWGQIASGSGEKTSACPVRPDDLACVIHTSGSTGRPKGVLVSHRNLVASTTARSAFYPEPVQRFLLLSSFAYDSSLAGIFWTLSQGGLLVVPDDETRRDPVALARLIREREITHLLGVPSLYASVLAESRDGDLASLRTAIVAGESCPKALLSTHASKAPGASLFNEYGPTETTVWSTVYACPPEAAGSSVPIGRPIANTQIYLLDENREPVPVGAPGEIFIGGDGVTRGYWRQPALTAERFVSNPFGVGSSRVYRTGDLARYLPDGNLEFLGRVDHQVKIRGVRVEPAQIEAVLEKHGQVRQAVVVAREDPSGRKRLIAYAVPKHPARPAAEELRRHLRERLPAPLVPETVVLLDALPLTPGGKLDRRALPDAGHARPALSEPFVAPRSASEEILAAIWEELLALPEVGARDDFFELGGDSLLATRVVSRIRDAFALELPLRRLFEAPTVSALAREIEKSRALSASLPAPPRVTPRPRGEELPLSFAQQRLWFLDQLEPGNPTYNIPAAFRLTGTLDAAVLQRSLQKIVARHEALRTAFPAVDGRPLQVVTDPETFPLTLHDFSGFPEPDRSEMVARTIREEVQRPFDLAGRPLLRARVLRLADRDSILLLTIHHIAADDWSLDVVFGELSAAYAAFAAGQEPSLPELTVQYADFAVCQREWLQGEPLRRLLTYWKSRLAGIPPLLELPVDRPRRPVRSSRGSALSATLSANLTRELRRLSRRHNVTLFMTLLGAFQALLHRYSGQPDIVVGTPIASRTRSEMEGLIGFFVNTLVMRTAFSGDPTFRTVLDRVRETALGAYAHQDLPFEKLVEELQPERSLSHTPLFQAMFVLQNAPPRTPELPGLAVRPMDVETGTAKFDLTLFVTAEGDELRCALEYSTDLFDAETAHRILRHFRNLLQGVVASPDVPVAALPILTAEERQRMLVEWNATWSEFPAERCVHELIEEQVRRTPDAPAVLFRGESLSFRELDTRANHLAHRLRAMGARLEDRVAVSLARTPNLLVALLGILKAGAAYLPLDASSPRDRLVEILEDSGGDIVLTDDATEHHFAQTRARRLNLDRERDLLAREPTSPVSGTAGSDTLAYVIYTSGSTGRPKGVMVEHRSLVNYLWWAIRAYRVEEGRGSLLHSSIAFDLAATSLFAPLLVGRSVVVAPGNGEAHLLGDALRVERGLSLVKLVPSQLEVLKQQIAPEELTGGVHAVVVGGEALSAESIAFWRTAAPGARFFNEYGPTEATVGCCAYEIPKGDLPAGPVPIGRPIANTRLYVLNSHLQPVPVRVPGELFIGGEGVARGYWGRPELNTESFLPDPVDPERGPVYRTGDLARYLPDGNLEFLGRLDHQVKLRGFRIELEEIESVLRKYPGVRETVVVTREDVPGDRRLVAYVVTEPASAPRNGELREFLEQRLPDYMVPSLFVPLESLPLGRSGKVDRQALPPPERTRIEADTALLAPRDAFEMQLKLIWEKVLNVRPVGVRDNFFDLGGHSLLAVRLFAELEKVYGQKIPLATIFQAPDVESLAAILRQKEWTPSWSSLVPIQPGGSRPPLFLVHGFGGNVVGYNDLARHLGPDQPVYGLQSQGLDGQQRPLTRLDEMAAAYVREIRAFQPDGPYFLGGLSFGGVVAFEMARQLSAQGAEIPLVALFDTYPPDSAISGSARRVGKWTSYRERFRFHAQRLFRGPDRLGYLRRKLRTLSRRGGSVFWHFAYDLSMRIGTRLPKALQRVSEANLEALRSYRPSVWDGRIVLFRARAPVVGLFYDPVAAWEALARGGVETIPVPGDHVTIIEEPNAAVLAECLRRCVARAQSSTGEPPVASAAAV